MKFVYMYFLIGTILALWGVLKSYEGHDKWAILVCVFLWPIVLVVSMLPDDPN